MTAKIEGRFAFEKKVRAIDRFIDVDELMLEHFVV
jgi:hypothetical protein